MARRSRSLAILLIAGAGLTASACSSESSSTSSGVANQTQSVPGRASVPMPGVGKKEVVAVTWTLQAPAGDQVAVTSVTLSNQNDAQLGNISAVAVATWPQAQVTTADVTAFVLIAQFPSRPTARTAPTPSDPALLAARAVSGEAADIGTTPMDLAATIGIRLYGGSPYESTTPVSTLVADCNQLQILDHDFETGSGYTTIINSASPGPAGGAQYAELVSLRPRDVQDSPNEQILDAVVSGFWVNKQCPGTPEGEDPKDT